MSDGHNGDDQTVTLTSGLVPRMQVEGFEGPLDLLLDLAERQRIDLGVISVLDLAEQFVKAAETLVEKVPLARRADWLVWVTRLVQLRAKLMFAPSAVAEEAAQEVERTHNQLVELLKIRAASAWLDGLPQLGRDVYARGHVAGSARAPATSSYIVLMEACLHVLEAELSLIDTQPDKFKLTVPDFWRVSDALIRVRSLLDRLRGVDHDWEVFFPTEVESPGLRRSLQSRAAVAGTFVAVLEMAKQGEVTLHQEEGFSGVVVSKCV